MRYASLVTLLMVVLAASTAGLAQTATPTEGTVAGNPTLDIVATDNRLTWGDDQTLTLTLGNEGSLVRGGPERFETDVTTARNVRLDVAADRLDRELADRVTVRSGPTLVGQLGRGDAVQRSLTVSVADSVAPGTYQLPLSVRYQYTALVRYGRGDPLYTERTTTRLVRVPLVVVDAPRLVVTPAESPPLVPGDNGSVSLTVTNTGTQTATDAGLTVSADSPVYFGDPGARQTSVFVAELPAGDSQTLTIPVGTRETATATTYLLRVTALYTTPGGFERTDRGRLGLPVARPPTATLRGSAGASVRRR